MKTVGALSILLLSIHALAAESPQAQQRAKECPSCAEWNTPQRPFRVFGDTYWVGPHGLGAILITSKGGHVLIDGALPESAPLIEANIRALGFHVEDIRLILNSHVHFDHAGASPSCSARRVPTSQRALSARASSSGAPRVPTTRSTAFCFHFRRCTTSA